MSEQPEHDRITTKNSTAPLVPLAILILYIALSGPALMVYKSCPEPIQEAIHLAYTPLNWLDKHIPGHPFGYYMILWYYYGTAKSELPPESPRHQSGMKPMEGESNYDTW